MAPGHLASVAVAAMLLAGCEEQFFYKVQNDLDHPVIVRFDSFGDILVEAGVNGKAPTAFGRFEGPITVLDTDCHVLHTVEVTTQVGSLWLRSDGSVRFVETEYDAAMALLPHTDACEGAT